MKNRELRRCLLIAVSLCSWLAGKLPSANGIPSFESFNSSLPNPDRPYEMVGGTVHYDSVPDFAIYDLEFAPSNQSQLGLPTRHADGSLEFDSTFDITYKAVVSFSTQPPHTVSGIGTARARGFAPADPAHDPNELSGQIRKSLTLNSSRSICSRCLLSPRSCSVSRQPCVPAA
jgi:hypothetical protein